MFIHVTPIFLVVAYSIQIELSRENNTRNNCFIERIFYPEVPVGLRSTKRSPTQTSSKWANESLLFGTQMIAHGRRFCSQPQQGQSGRQSDLCTFYGIFLSVPHSPSISSKKNYMSINWTWWSLEILFSIENKRCFSLFHQLRNSFKIEATLPHRCCRSRI